MKLKLCKMKNAILTLFLLLFAGLSVNAQIMRTEELEKYAKKKYGENWVEKADELTPQLTLDKNNAINYVQIISAEGKTKEQLYIILNYWFTSTFNDANSVIKLNDKDLGTIIASGHISNIAKYTGWVSVYFVSLSPVIKCDIKDEKVRITYTIPFFEVIKHMGAGLVSPEGIRYDEKWTLDSCYPFAEKDKHKKASSKALVMANAYSNVIMDKIEECIKNGLTGNETENW